MSTETDTLLEFCRTGCLGPLGPGLSTEAVEAALGTADDVSVDDDLVIAKYGSVQLTFSAEYLVLVAVYLREGSLDIPDGVAEAIEPRWLDMSREELYELLENEQLTSVARQYDDVLSVTIEPSGVRATFPEDKLDSVQVPYVL